MLENQLVAKLIINWNDINRWADYRVDPNGSTVQQLLLNDSISTQD